MENITHQFNDCYLPEKALLIYRCHADRQDGGNTEESIYVESYDIGKNGKPINAHPLTQKEMISLSTLFQSSKELNRGFLKSKALIPTHVLQLNPQGEGSVCWYTTARKATLLFTASLGIASGEAGVPAMIWKATKNRLTVFAIKGSKKPTHSTPLYHAPFFNIYADGNVCMGTVDTDIPGDCCLEDFIQHWENYFWNSYFSHMMEGFNPVNGNMVLLWKELLQSGEDFPASVLRKTNYTLQNILS